MFLSLLGQTAPVPGVADFWLRWGSEVRECGDVALVVSMSDEPLTY